MELRRGMRRSSAIHETFREETMSRNIPFFEMFAELQLSGELRLKLSGAELTGARIDLIPIAEEVERRLANCKKNITVAVMGCAVNGPGEASAADIGIAGGKGEGLLFRKGEVLYKVPQEQLVDALMAEIEKL